VPLLAAGHFAKLALGFPQLTENAFRFWQEGLAEHGQLGKAGLAIEKPRAELRVELQDLLRERRLSDVLYPGSAGECAVTGDCAKITELVNFYEAFAKLLRRKSYRNHRKDIFYVCLLQEEHKQHGKRTRRRTRGRHPN
jgi:hypothetical protein